MVSAGVLRALWWTCWMLIVAVEGATQRNILHIIVDDLRPELGAYGLANRSTPNIDALAARGTVFDRAYCQQGVCGPSRNSFLSGRRPDASQSWNFINHFREQHPEWTSLPGIFLKAGMLSLASGKTFHPKLPPAYDSNNSWSTASLPVHNPCWNTADYPKDFKFQDGGLPCVFCPVDIAGHVFKANLSVANDHCPIDALEDTLSVSHGIELMQQAKKQGKNFYLAVGMHKPHIPWQASLADFAKHPLDSVDLPTHTQPPVGMPEIAYRMTDGEAHDSPYDPVSDTDTRSARRAYRAAVTGMDRKLGPLLAELDRLELTDNTAVVLHSDHGWHLGEGGSWRKFTNFELVARVPMIIRAPWLKEAPSRSSALAELVDLAPTLAELAGVPLPEHEHFDGVSLVPVLQGAVPKVKEAAFTQYPRRVNDPSKAWSGNAIIHRDRTDFTHMGYSIRTSDWRYTEWVVWNQTSLTPVWGAVAARELYDHRSVADYPTDMNAHDLVNLAANQTFSDQVATLSKQIQAQFQTSPSKLS
eukprot:TRINITY_DN10496_c0_g1_i1.p1 TRINITY_DN10496_c0_g1~~TRINITY_DN10496_c0_g1_i1.p1  ORF type:complete len:530 (+),score=91.34 TRINITY_DN10496_c0_g1_i1:188-1777(+)